MKYLVTGGTGFIGGNLTRKLIENGHEVYVTGFEKENTPNGAVFLSESFIDIDWNAIPPLDAVFHIAANNDTTETNREKMFEANVTNSQKLFEAVFKSGCKKIIYASSAAVYGNLPAPLREDMGFAPLNVYAESKVALDQYAMNFAKEHSDMLVVGLRYCNVYGPGEKAKGKRASMIPQLAHQIKDNSRPKLFEFGEQKRDYVYVKDVVRANILALNAKASTIVNCASGQAISFNDLVKIINEVLGTNQEPVYIPNPYLKSYQSNTKCDMSKAKREIAFVPEFDIKSGVEDYYKTGQMV